MSDGNPAELTDLTAEADRPRRRLRYYAAGGALALAGVAGYITWTQVKPNVDAARKYGSISYEDLHARYHADLANGLGNLASRVAAMIGKYFDGALPPSGDVTPAEQAIIDLTAQAVADADAAIDALAPHEALALSLIHI